LHRGGFVWPTAGDTVFQVTEAQYPLGHKWHWLVAGVDSHRAILPDALRVNANPLQADLWQRLSALPQAHWQA